MKTKSLNCFALSLSLSRGASHFVADGAHSVHNNHMYSHMEFCSIVSGVKCLNQHSNTDAHMRLIYAINI